MAIRYLLFVIRYWLLVIGYWLLVIRYSLLVIVIPIIFRSVTVSVATREQDAPTLSLMVFIWNDYIGYLLFVIGNFPLSTIH